MANGLLKARPGCREKACKIFRNSKFQFRISRARVQNQFNNLSNLLFICSKNHWRSLTAELLFKNHPIHEARSAGTSDKARIKVNGKLIEWADVIFVMERKHNDLLKQRFALTDKKLIVLDIADDYKPFLRSSGPVV